MESGFTIFRQRSVAYIRSLFRKFRFMTVNREIMVFLLFLIVAVGFWLSQTFKDHTTVNLEYELRIINQPKNLIFTSDLPSNISASVSGRGFSIMQYLVKRRHKVLNVDYNDLPKMGGVLTIDNYVWKKTLTKELPKGVTMQSVIPSTVDIYYSMGEHKQIPIEFQGKIRTSDEYLLCGIEIHPKYVDVYASSNIYDTIKVVYTEPVILDDIKDTLQLRLPLSRIKGVKMIPDTVSVKACVDLFTTKTVKVPIYCENIPHNKILRTFPLMADVTFKVSATMFNHITQDDFIIVIDYNTIKPQDRKCKLILRESPQGIYNIRISPEVVDYVIEQED